MPQLSIVKSEPIPAPPVADPHQAVMSPAPPANPDAVTVKDLQDDPRAAFAKIGSILGRDLSNPRTWVMAAAAYFGPKIVGSVIPIAREAETAGATTMAAPAGPSMVSRIGAAAKAAGPDAVGIVSPRLGKGIDLIRSAINAYRAGAPEAPTGAPVETSPAAPVPVAPSVAVPTPPPSPSPAVAVPKLKLTAEEFQAVNKLVREGYPLPQVLEHLQRLRLPAAWQNLPTDAEVAAAVKNRNASGRWPEEP